MSEVPLCTLVAHMRAHSGKRTSECQTCGKAFSQSGSLARHCRQVHADAQLCTEQRSIAPGRTACQTEKYRERGSVCCDETAHVTVPVVYVHDVHMIFS